MALACRADDVSRTKASGHPEIHLQNSSAGLVTCYITQPDNHVFHVEVDHKAEGQEVLEKICRMLGIIDESEYFGIQYAGLKGDLIWLNMRNRISRQLPGTPPYHLFIKVKYYVPPHTLLLEGTRHQFYLNVAQQLTRGLWDADMSVELQARLVALMTYVQFGPFNPATTPCKYACFWSDRREEISAEFIRLAASYHRELGEMPVHQAEYELLRIAHLEVPAYGLYYYEVKDMFDHRLLIGVGPEFVAVCATDTSFIEKYPYCRLQTVTVTNRVVTLNLLEDDGSVKSRPFQLTCIRAANSLYRSITEVHCFFLCDNVRDDVLQQTNRDLRETLTSLFDHNSKDYAFDVRLTCREVYDRARRRLYNTATEVAAVTPAADISPGERSAIDPLSSSNGGLSTGVASGGGVTASMKHSETVVSHPESAASIEEFQEAVQEQLREALICRVCMDNPINCVFFPCGHTICCKECADRVDQCPVCRKSIELRHPCFLPWDSESEIVGSEPPTSPLSSRLHHAHKHNTSRVLHNSQRGSSLGLSYSPDAVSNDGALSDAHSLPNLAPPLNSTPSPGSSSILKSSQASKAFTMEEKEEVKRELPSADVLIFHQTDANWRPKDYAFDVRLTCREVYDRARRRLYNTATEVAAVTPAPDISPGERSAIDPLSSSNGGLSTGVASGGGVTASMKHSETVVSHPESAASIEEFQEAVQEQLREALICRVCMDNPINCVFFPCGHTICCKECADRVDQCPVCRKSIELRHPCFLPWDSESEIVGSEPPTSPLSSRLHHAHKHNTSRVLHNSQRGSSLGLSYSPDAVSNDGALSDAHSLPNLAPPLNSTPSPGSSSILKSSQASKACSLHRLLHQPPPSLAPSLPPPRHPRFIIVSSPIFLFPSHLSSIALHHNRCYQHPYNN
nr:unnamed protein product [Spirometra erinaceieuropaei]